MRMSAIDMFQDWREAGPLHDHSGTVYSWNRAARDGHGQLRTDVFLYSLRYAGHLLGSLLYFET